MPVEQCGEPEQVPADAPQQPIERGLIQFQSATLRTPAQDAPPPCFVQR